MPGKLMRMLLPLLIGTVMLGGTALAQEPGTVTLTPMVGYHAIDGGLDLENGAAYGLSLGYNATQNWTVEGDFRYTPTESDSGSIDVDIWSVSLGGLYHFNPDAVLRPYLSFGAGMMVYEIEHASDNDEDVFGYYGGGLKYGLSDSVDLRLDLRHILDYRSDNDNHIHDDTTWRHHFQAMLGVAMTFGGPAKAAPVVMVEPAPAPVAKAPVDSDGDGVLDSADKCPGTAPGVRVTANGCPADTDGDGVADFEDACVNTPQGAEVDSRGCSKAEPEVASLTLDLLFGVDKDQVTPFHYAELNKAAKFIAKYPQYKIVVEGHTDDQGSDTYNQELSQRRADNVRKALVTKYGVDAGRIAAVGYGEAQPVASNATDAGRVKNRRVEISVRP